MKLGTRKVVDRSFTGLGVFSIALVAAVLIVLLAPIIVRGLGAFVFRGTVEFRHLMLAEFGHGDPETVAAEVADFVSRRNELFARVQQFEDEHIVPVDQRWSLSKAERAAQSELAGRVADFKERLHKLLGPQRELAHQLRRVLPPDTYDQWVAAGKIPPPAVPYTDPPAVPRERYGATRGERAQVALHHVLYRETWVQPPDGDGNQMLEKAYVSRVDDFKDTALAAVVRDIEQHADEILRPRWTFYVNFLFDPELDSHIFGGIWAELLGTLYLTVGAILFAVPMGIISAIYLVEYAPEGWVVGILRSCISTLAGVPSIVFGLFGLAFFINGIHVSPARSVLAGSLTLAVLILPVVIRASEEAIRAVPRTYKEAALSVGASKWHTIVTVILPAALPGVLTGIVISMGRAAGETAPIIFTAAVSFGAALSVSQTLTHGTPALPWNVYNLCTEHEAVDEIRHVQYGMVLTLVLLVLMLNGTAIIMRARISRKLSG